MNLQTGIVIAVVIAIIVAIVLGLYFGLRKEDDTPAISVNTSPVSQETTISAEIIKKNASILVLEYKGVTGDEQMDITVNGKIILSENAVPKEYVTKTIDLSADQYPVKTVVVNFKNDSGSRDIYFKKALLDGVDIRPHFVSSHVAATDTARQEMIKQGKFLWGGTYTYNV